MSKKLLIVFVKNVELGRVKTRLAATIGDDAALLIYKTLLSITREAVQGVDPDLHIYYSNYIEKNKWVNSKSFVQCGNNLGEKMYNAFTTGFEQNYEELVLIGSDLPTLSKSILSNAFQQLRNTEVVFGPAQDGGYYLIGMTKMYASIFQNKSWSTSTLLNETLAELKSHNLNIGILETLNDIDTFEDLEQFPELLKLVK